LLAFALSSAAGNSVVAQTTEGAPGGWYGSGQPLPPIVGPSPYLPDGRTIDGHTGQPIPCLCRAYDRAYKVGEVVCLSTARGLYKARCTRDQNITSWQIGNEPCATQ
jgi:hypothetical protein